MSWPCAAVGLWPPARPWIDEVAWKSKSNWQFEWNFTQFAHTLPLSGQRPNNSRVPHDLLNVHQPLHINQSIRETDEFSFSTFLLLSSLWMCKVLLTLCYMAQISHGHIISHQEKWSHLTITDLLPKGSPAWLGTKVLVDWHWEDSSCVSLVS